MNLAEQVNPTASNEVAAPNLSPAKETNSPSHFVAGLRWLRLPAVTGTVGTQLGMFGLHALHSIILARLLGPHARGEYGTVVLFTQTLMYAGMLGTNFSLARRSGMYPDQRGQLANASLRVGFVTGTLCLAVVCALALFALPAAKAYLAPMCMVTALLLPFEHCRLALLAVDHGSGTFGRYNYNRLFAAAVFPLLLGLAWTQFEISATVGAYLLVLTTIISLIALIAVHTEVGITKPSAPSVKLLLREGVPYSTAYFAAQLLCRLDVLLSLWLLSISDQGYYAVALAASSLMQVVPNALALFSFNLGAKQHSQLKVRSIALAGLAVLALQTISAFVMVFVLQYCLPLIFGAKYDLAIPLALALLPGLAIDGIATVAEGYLRGRGRPMSTLVPRILGAIALVMSAFLLFPTWQALSIPIASSIGLSVSGMSLLALVVWQQSHLDSQPKELK